SCWGTPASRPPNATPTSTPRASARSIAPLSQGRRCAASAKSLFVESPLAGVHRSPLGSGPVGCRWHKGFGPGVHESTDPGLHEKPPHRTAPLEWRSPMSIIMRATLHDHAPNTYYGHWPRFFGLQSRPRLASQCPSRDSVGPVL